MKSSLLAFLATILFSSFFFLQKNPTINRNKNIYRDENPTEAYDALSFLTTMNSFPNAEIPKDGYAKAWDQHLQIPSSNNTGVRSMWTNYGPNNIGGRTISIAIDPTDTSIVWLGSASGGLWKSATGGIGVGAWTYIPTGFPVLGVGAIAINPGNHSEMYIGTGETYAYGTSTNGVVDRTQRGSYGIGILKTTDGGATWTKVLDWSYQDNRGVWDIVYDPSDASILYAATTEGVYKTSDAGVTWTLVLNRKMVMDLVIDHVNSGTVFAAVGNEDSQDKGIYRTQDSGNNWVLLTNGLPANTQDGRITLADWPADHNLLMAIIGNRYSTVGVYRSTNGGNSWTLKSTDEILAWQGWYAKGLLMKTSDNTQVLAGGVNLFKSTSSGSNFSDIAPNLYYFHSDVHGIISNPLDPNKIYIITDGGLYRSNDFGNTSYDCNKGYVTSQHYIGAVSATNPNLFISGLQDNYTDMYNGSLDWNVGVWGGDGTYTAIDQTNDAIQFGASQYLNIGKTTDYWSYYSTDYVYSSPADPNGGNPAAFLAPFILCPSDNNTMYAGSSTLIKSTSAGDFYSWFNVQPDPIDNGNPVLSIASSALDPDTVYFATAPGDVHPMHVYRSFDGGNSKTDISSGLPNRYPRRITVNPHNAKEVYVVFSGFNGGAGGHIFKSENAGSTWTDISTPLPDLPFHCLAVDPDFPQNLYAGCDFTVYGSYNGGATWFTYSEGLPQAVMVFDLVISPSDKSIYAFTYGNGVYKNEMFDPNVGVQTVNSISSVKIFPNPASAILTIDLSRYTENLTLYLFSTSGRLVREEKIPSAQKIDWDVTGISIGTYFLKVKGSRIDFTTKVAVVR
ncbi:MAG TPA: T9SS type A sorting domain-containing protein [Chitinophagales bacterium]|nr:T9SS type A sorting domain-containing protein [Chitinophagales bacterium]